MCGFLLLSDWPVALAQSANPNEKQLIHFQPARGHLQDAPWHPKSRTLHLLSFVSSFGDVTGFCAAIGAI